MSDDGDESADFSRLWAKGVDLRNAWKKLVPSFEDRAFDNLAEDADLDLLDEAIGYQASLLEGLRRGHWMAVGRLGPGKGAPYRLVPPDDCFNTTLKIHEGCLSAPNLSLERVVVLFDPPPSATVATTAELGPGSRERNREEVSRVAKGSGHAQAPQASVTKMGRRPIDDLLRAIVRELRDDPKKPLAGLLQKEREAEVRRLARERHPFKFPRATTPSRSKILEALAAEGV